MTQKTIFYIAGLALLSAGCGAAPAALGPAPGLAVPAAAQLATAGAAPSAGGYAAVGTVESRTTVTVSARVAGYVTAVNVATGDRVRAGEVLVTLATPEAAQQVTQARAAVTSATAGLEAAHRQAGAAAAQAALAASTFKRYQQLQQKQAVSPHEFDQVATANQAAAAEQAAARARQQAAASALTEAQSELAQARTRAGYSTLTAPFDGVVTAKPAAVGDLATPGAPLVELAADAGWQLAVSVPNRLLGGLKVGQAVAATLDSLPGPLPGARIREIAPASDPRAHAAIVKVALPAAPGLRAGLYGQVLLPSAAGTPAAPAMTVPETSLVRFGELDELYVVDAGGRAELRLVTVGASASGRAEILSGLNSGERFVVNPAVLAAGPGGNRVP